MPAPRKPKIPDLTPQDRDQLGAWVESTVASYQHHIEQAADLPAETRDSAYMKAQLQHWKQISGFARWLAYRIRTAKTKRLTTPDK